MSLIDDWCAFCDEGRDFDKSHFYAEVIVITKK